MAIIETGHHAIALVGGGRSAVPAVIEDAGESARRRFLEFFAASIRNPNTRAAYAQACGQFFAVIEASALTVHQVQPVHVAAYIEQLGQRVSAPTVKQHLAAIRRLFDFLVIGQILPTNPAASVRGPRHVVTEGKTPILEAEEVRTLFAQFDAERLIDLRDRAILGAMVYSFARVGAVAKLRVKDYYRQGVRAWFVLDEKGGKQNRVPAHHQAAEYIEQYLAAAGIEAQREMALFRSMGRGRGGQAVTQSTQVNPQHGLKLMCLCGLGREGRGFDSPGRCRKVFLAIKLRSSQSALPQSLPSNSSGVTGLSAERA